MDKQVSEFLCQHQLKCPPETRYMDLVSEVGELGKELLKGSQYGKEKLKITKDTELELGDCLFALLALCHELEIDGDSALKKALEKYSERLKVTGSPGSE